MLLPVCRWKNLQVNHYTHEELRQMEKSELISAIEAWQFEFPFMPEHGIALPTVDIALVRLQNKKTQVLLVQKPAETGTHFWRFPGGFIDTIDESGEHAAYRELFEETGIIVKAGSLMYITNTKVPDPRYLKRKNKIFTTFYKMEWKKGDAGEGPWDDIARTKWFNVSELAPEIMNPTHRQLFEKFLELYS